MFDFSATQWSQVGRAGHPPQGEDEERRAWEAAWSHLTCKYGTVFEYVAQDVLRRRGGGAPGAHQAEDVVQGFLVACIEKGWLAQAAPEFGRFRAFVFTLLRRYTLNYVAAISAQKRRPTGGIASLEVLAPSLLPEAEASLPRAWDEAWFQCLFHAAMERVRERSPANADVLGLAYIQGIESNEEIAELLDSEPARVALNRHRGIKMLRQELTHELRATVSSQDEERLEAASLTSSAPSAVLELLHP